MFPLDFASNLHSAEINAHSVSSYRMPTQDKLWYSDSEHLAEANSYTAEKMVKYFAHFWGGKGETSMDNIKKLHENTLAFELQVLGFSICMLEMIKVLEKKSTSRKTLVQYNRLNSLVGFPLSVTRGGHVWNCIIDWKNTLVFIALHEFHYKLIVSTVVNFWHTQ